MEDEQDRYIEAIVELPRVKPRQCTLRVASLYVPNVNPFGSVRFAYKLDWLTRLIGHVRQLVRKREVVLFGGDYNVAPSVVPTSAGQGSRLVAVVWARADDNAGTWA